jgi:hypothetical protein
MWRAVGRDRLGWKQWRAVLAALVAGTAGAAEPAAEPMAVPVDPFDYSYCGGKPVYPVIGFNFATACGPRNQMGLGRRGHLMWLVPPRRAGEAPSRGKRLLSEEELKHLSLLAEVVQLADPPVATVGQVMYDLGVDFQGRPYKRAHAPVSDAYTPANALFQALLALVPDAPVLPECAGERRDFSPTLPTEERADASPDAGGARHAAR